ncbi:MAG: succinate dehydrogenase, cytochrome b556 subunit [Candidatus Omnitrophica bacterium CG11_big_fil_rev_8_21_14_0_20_63_9]|nr:MAG: succinate dehydrogenase, cytochrome b556 subunit [Candidatus Omnitrophica bacterium CG11_big_fil_rev_8_21_14_0_20_63_9]
MSVYRGGVGQWSWLLHRVTGVGVLVFLLLHIVDTALVILGPEHYDAIIQLYRHPAFRVMEVGLFASLLFHAINGVRIILMDFWVDLMRFHRQFFYAQMAILAVLMVPVTWLMLKPVFFK